jgi:farnesyl-diphosphate farnesyltransferase
MNQGMIEFERNRDRSGLTDVAELERYCYFVAGVVGEMLTDLCCAHSPRMESRRDRLESTRDPPPLGKRKDASLRQR